MPIVTKVNGDCFIASASLVSEKMGELVTWGDVILSMLFMSEKSSYGRFVIAKIRCIFFVYYYE